MVSVKVEGAARVAAAFRSLGLKARDLSPAFQRIGAKVKADAATLAPTLTGRLAADLRTTKAKTRATVAVGRASVPYAGPINYGWPGHNIEATYFLNRAAEANEDESRDEILNEMNRLIRRVGLN